MHVVGACYIEGMLLLMHARGMYARYLLYTGVLSTQQRGASATAAASSAVKDDEPLVLPLDDLLAVRRCAEPSLPEGGGIWISTQALSTVS